MTAQNFTTTEIKERLATAPQRSPHNHFPQGFLNGTPREAAVLLPLLKKEDGWHLLFIRRTKVEGDIHSGQVAFPGGRRDAEDQSLEATALRETHEELGIAPKDVEILGKLNDFIVISNYKVTPVVGVLPWPYSLTLGEDEVSRAFTIPLAWLMDPTNHTVSTRDLPTPDKKPISVIYFEEYDGELLWGASARFLLDFIELLNSDKKT